MATSEVMPDRHSGVSSAEELLPSPAAWRAVAAHHRELFAPLDPGVRIALFARAAPARMLVWEAGEGGVDVRVEPFVDYGSCAADIVLSADAESLRAVRTAAAPRLFEVMRAGIRSGRVVCYVLKRRRVLEERGLEEMMDALGFAPMGACR